VLKRICTEDKHYRESIKELTSSLLSRQYKKQQLEEQFHKTASLNRNEILKYKTKPKKTTQIPFVVTYNKTLPKINDAIEKCWNILHINKDLKDTFFEKPFIAYRRNRNLRDYIGQTTLINNKKTKKKKLTTGKCKPCMKCHVQYIGKSETPFATSA